MRTACTAISRGVAVFILFLLFDMLSEERYSTECVVELELGAKSRDARNAGHCRRPRGLRLHPFEHLSVVVFVNPRRNAHRQRHHARIHVAVLLVGRGNVIRSEEAELLAQPAQKFLHLRSPKWPLTLRSTSLRLRLRWTPQKLRFCVAG